MLAGDDSEFAEAHPPPYKNGTIMLSKKTLTCWPIVVAPITIAMEMRLAITAYSIAVVPSASRASVLRADRAAWARAANPPPAWESPPCPSAAPI